MEQLIITYYRCEEFVTSWNMTECVEYSSLAQFLDDLEAWCEANPNQSPYVGKGFLGTDVSADAVYAKDGYSDFQVRTLVQWFEDEKKGALK